MMTAELPLQRGTPSRRAGPGAPALENEPTTRAVLREHVEQARLAATRSPEELPKTVPTPTRTPRVETFD